jgi:hypothetical protein
MNWCNTKPEKLVWNVICWIVSSLLAPGILGCAREMGLKLLSKPFVPRFIAFHRTRWATAFAKTSMISSSAPWPVESAAVLWCPKEWNLINSSGTKVVFLSWFSIDCVFYPIFLWNFWANTWARCPDRGDLGEMRRDYIQTDVKSNAWQRKPGIIWDLGVCLGKHMKYT